MEIKKNVDVPKVKRGDPKFTEMFEEVLKFAENEDEVSMVIECETREEGRRCYSAMVSRVKSAELPLKVWSRGEDVYFTKVGKKNV